MRLAPITLIFGPNASGKSSISRAIRLLRQSVGKADDLVFNGDDVQLQTPQNVIYGQGQRCLKCIGNSVESEEDLHDCDGVFASELGVRVWFDFESVGSIEGFPLASVGITQTIESQRTSHRAGSPIDVRKGPSHLSTIVYAQDESTEVLTSALEATIPLDGSQGAVFASELALKLAREHVDGGTDGYGLYLRARDELGVEDSNHDEPDEDDAEPADDVVYFDSLNKAQDEALLERVIGAIDLEASKLLLSGSSKRPKTGIPAGDWRPSISTRHRNKMGVEPTNNLDWRDADVARVFLELLTDPSECLRILLAGLNHIGPVRQIPSRIELMSDAETEILKNEVSHQWLLRLTGGRYLPISQVAAVQDTSGTIFVRSNSILDTFSGTAQSFSDVGAGVSQVLPILDGIFQSANSDGTYDGMVLIEQPELHLHPKMQADLVEAFVESVTAENSFRQLLIETHSEAMLLRLQKLIREGKIPSDYATVLFVEPAPPREGAPEDEPRSNIMYNIDFLASGELENEMPLSFAGLRLRDLL